MNRGEAMFSTHDRAARRLRHSSRRSSQRRALFLENLEERRLLATLTITGTAGNDAISAYVASGLLNISVNGSSFSLPSNLIDRLQVNALGGDDAIKIDS